MQRKYSAQDIYEQLRSMIVGFNILPGTRVTESQIADFFAVSRTPVRAALQKLETEGLLSIKAKQGCFVRNIDVLQISHYYDVRVALENFVVEELGRMKDLSPIERLAGAWNPRSPAFGLQITEALKMAEEQFHVDLAGATRNFALENYIRDVNDHIRVVRRLGWPDSKSVSDTYEEHYEICHLLLARKVEQAKAEMTRHIRKSQDLASRITLKQIYGARRGHSVFEQH